MSVSRLTHITQIGVEQMGALADSLEDPEVLRLENLDTDLRPPAGALAFTKRAVDDDAANSYLPFFGLDSVRQAATRLVARQSGQAYDWKTECLISAGGLSGILNVLLATLEPGDEVLLTDPIYVGLVNRVRLAGGVPRFVPLLPSAQGWRLDVAALASLDPHLIKAALLMSPSMPTGAVFTQEEWSALIAFCQQAGCWLINDAAMERIVYDGRPVIHPAAFPGMRERVISVGSASKEYRMIGWRVGWVVGPADIVADVARVSISNVVCQTGRGNGRRCHRHQRSRRRHCNLCRGMAAPPGCVAGRVGRLCGRSAPRWLVVAAGCLALGPGWRHGFRAPARLGQDCGDADGQLGQRQQ